MNLSARDILARTLEAEAGNQGALGMMSVGSVIMNRLKNPAYGSDIHSVILQPGQFSVWNKATGHAGGSQGRDMSSVIPSETAFMVTDQLLDQNYNDPTGGATHFYNPSLANPSWGKTAGGEWKTIGDHLFGVPVNSESSTMSLLNPNNQNTSSNPPNLFQYIGNAVGGGLENLGAAISGEDQDKSDRLAMAMMSLSGSPDLQPLIADAANNIALRAKTKTNNKTIEYLHSVNPELAKLALANPASIPNIISSIAGNTLNPKNKKSTITGAEAKKFFPNAKLEDNELYNIEYGPDDKPVRITPVGKTQFNLGGDNDPSKKIDERLFTKMGETFEQYLNIGNKSAAIMTDLRVLEGLVPVQPSGTIPGTIARMFPQLDNAAAMRQSIVSRIAPLLRVEGSGSTSDIEFEAMLNSYGSLLNSPEANAAILSIFRMKQEFNVARAAIVRKYITSTDPNKVKVAMEEMAALESQSGIPDAVKNVIAQYTDPNIAPIQNNQENKPNSKTWDPTANDGAGGFV
mgnify:CR=1 FL=1